MTAKRFHYHIDEVGIYYYICDNTKKGDDRIILELGTKYDAMEVCELLNELHEEKEQLQSRINDYDVALKTLQDLTERKLKENEQLKQINRNLQDFRNFITEQNVLNEKQRKELQLQMLRLYNYFENWFEDTMSPNAFSEMWDSVKEDKKWEKSGMDDCGTISNNI